MKENKEIYNDSLALTKEGKWGMKFFVVIMFFSLTTHLLLNLLQGVLNVAIPEPPLVFENTAQLNEYIGKLGDLSIGKLFCLVGGRIVMIFINVVLMSAMAVGMGRIALNIVKGNYSFPSLKDIFCGFPQPFSMFWLYCRVVLGIVGRVLIAMIPLAILYICTKDMGMHKVSLGIVAFIYLFALAVYSLIVLYRYRLVWFLKADNIDKSANWCVRESIRLMNGNKKRLFRLDCRFAGYFLLIALYAVVFVVVEIVPFLSENEIIATVLYATVLFLTIGTYFRFIAHFSVTMANFYRALLEDQQ